MFHTTLYRLERGQKRLLAALGLLFSALSILWFVLETIDASFPMEPIVVFVGGVATLFASYWPWRPSYADRRLQGRASIDYMSNNHRFDIGREELAFELRFSKCSHEQIYIYKDSTNIDSVALAHGASRISDLRDVLALDFSMRVVSPAEGEIIVLRNVHGNYAAVQVHDIRDKTRSDDRNEVTITWAINPDKGADFS